MGQSKLATLWLIFDNQCEISFCGGDFFLFWTLPLLSSGQLLFHLNHHSLLSSLLSSPLLSSRSALVFSFCSPKMKKAKRRLTVDPFDFELGCDYLIEPRGRSNQVNVGPKKKNPEPAFHSPEPDWSACNHTTVPLSVSASACFCFLSLPNTVWFNQTICY